MSQFPHREGDRAPFTAQGWHLTQRDIDKLFRALERLSLTQANISSAAILTLAGLIVNGNITVTGTVDGIDVSDLADATVNQYDQSPLWAFFFGALA